MGFSLFVTPIGKVHCKLFLGEWRCRLFWFPFCPTLKRVCARWAYLPNPHLTWGSGCFFGLRRTISCASRPHTAPTGPPRPQKRQRAQQPSNKQDTWVQLRPCGLREWFLSRFVFSTDPFLTGPWTKLWLSPIQPSSPSDLIQLSYTYLKF